MINSGRSFFSQKRPRSATFHIQENFAEGFRKRHGKRRGPLGLPRAVMSAFSICVGLSAAFVALHYIPAHLSPATVMRVSDLDEQAVNDRADGAFAFLAPYWDSLQTRRTYVWAGETVEIQYDAKQNANLQLVIKRCASQIIVEVFSCQVESEQVINVSKKRGKHRLRFEKSGFYHFSEIQKGDARVIWRRVE